MQLVAPRAVTIAVAILAIICTMNLMVSLFVIIFNFFTFLPFQLFTFKRWGFCPNRLISLSGYIARWLCVSAIATVLVAALRILDVAAVATGHALQHVSIFIQTGNLN